jgi:hypothetical protein
VALPPTELDMLLGGGRAPKELHELLGRVRCLTPRGLADQLSVIWIMERVAEAYQPPIQVGSFAWPPGGGHTCKLPSLWQAIERELTEADLLDMRSFDVGFDPQNRYGPVDAIVAEVRALSDAQHAVATATDTCWLREVFDAKLRAREGAIDPEGIRCPECHRALPEDARYCVWCGHDLTFICSCGGR